MIDFLTRKKPEFGEFNDGVTRRTGVVGVKLGMTRFWDSYWQEVPLTMIYVRFNILVLTNRFQIAKSYRSKLHEKMEKYHYKLDQ
jgi:hypothetical protein